MMAAPGTRGSTPTGLIDQAAEAFDAYRAGDRQCLGALVDLLTPILWHTARSQGADAGRAEDVVQTAWLRLVDHSERIVDPRLVLAWLMTTVRREAARQVRLAGRDVLDLDSGPEPASSDPDPELHSILGERQSLLWEQVSALPQRCQELIRVIAFAQRPDYAGIAESLGVPIGSIGPTRGRCLDKLRRGLLADRRWEDHSG